jgi:hypothetical protein
MEANLHRASRDLRGVANLRRASSSVAPVRFTYERSLRPSPAWFSRPQAARVAAEAR